AAVRRPRRGPQGAGRWQQRPGGGARAVPVARWPVEGRRRGGALGRDRAVVAVVRRRRVVGRRPRDGPGRAGDLRPARGTRGVACRSRPWSGAAGGQRPRQRPPRRVRPRLRLGAGQLAADPVRGL
ncbi:MAG: hypothetical protein AVDCRST_MAG36-2055, partial [uncultured Nocardioidaceae bacterium]